MSFLTAMQAADTLIFAALGFDAYFVPEHGAFFDRRPLDLSEVQSDWVTVRVVEADLPRVKFSNESGELPGGDEMSGERPQRKLLTMRYDATLFPREPRNGDRIIVKSTGENFQIGMVDNSNVVDSTLVTIEFACERLQ